MGRIPHHVIRSMVCRRDLSSAQLYLLYTSRLGDIIRKHDMEFHFYADDSKIYFSFDSATPNCSFVVSRIEACIHDLVSWMSCNKLKLKGDKMELAIISP